MAKFKQHRDRLCARMIERKVKHKILNAAPSHKYIAENNVFTVNLDLQSHLEQEYVKFDAFTAANDIRGLIQRYPAKETGALRDIALKLGFQNNGKYEMAVRKVLVDDDEARNIIKGSLGDLATELT